MLSWSYNGGFFEKYLCMGQMIASVAQAPLVPAFPQQGGSVEPPESFAYLASQVCSLLVAQKEKQKAGLAPHRVLQTGYAKKMAVAIFS